MIEEINVDKSLDFIRDNAEKLAEAKATRIYLEQFRKSKKALLMNDVEGAEHIRSSHAYSDEGYLLLLENYRDAVREEEYLKWMMTAAQLKIDVYRTQQANNRFIDKVHT